jgi:hypothetical protein
MLPVRAPRNVMLLGPATEKDCENLELPRTRALVPPVRLAAVVSVKAPAI